MKKIIIKKILLGLSLLVLMVPFIGCDGDLEITNPNAATADTFWRNEADAESGLISAYASLPTVHAFGRIHLAQMLIQRSDIANPYPGANVQDAGHFAQQPAMPRIREIYTEMYKLVSATNQVLGRVPSIEDIDSSRQTEILAEAHFLRGLAYFYIVNQWGDAPMPLNEVFSLEDIFLPATPEAGIWAQIESDFTAAMNGLPVTAPKDEFGRPTSGSARGLLGRAQLYQSKWTEAANTLEPLITGGTYQLTTEYTDNFSQQANNNSESVYEVQFDGNGTGGWGGSADPGDGGNVWRTFGIEADIAPKGFTGQASMRVNDWVLNLFLAQTTNGGLEDPRAAATLVWNYPGCLVYQTTFVEGIPAGNQNQVFARKHLNFDDYESANDGGWIRTNNWRLLRYADVLLMYAEAINEANGPSAAAYDAINEVRARVDMPDYAGLNQADLRQAIRDERVRELALEGHRWFDLRRWDILETTFANSVTTLKSEAGGIFEPKHKYLPLPQNDIDSNPNLEQHPLWR